MKNLEYKGYTGSIEYSPDDNTLYGRVLGIRSLISYEGKTGNDLEEDFRQAVDAYLQACADESRAPEKPFKGSFNVRISSDLHQKAALLAMDTQTSLNSFVADAIRERVARDSKQ